jgi:hypothetical protein
MSPARLLIRSVQGVTVRARYLAVVAGAKPVTGPAAGTQRRWGIGYLALLVATGLVAVFFSRFTAEDAYITYRYAENLVNTGALVFNPAEPINALTSPLHALVSAGLYALTGQTLLSNKLLAGLLLLFSALLVASRFRGERPWQLLALCLVLLPPSVLLWTFGGLETPLLLFLITAVVCLADRAGTAGLGWLCGVLFLAGLAFLTRFDSALFCLPVVVFALTRARSAGHAALALAGGALLPAAWLATSLVYYGDLLPTSFYVKTPNGSIWSLAYNGVYVGSYLVWVGIVPALLLAVALAHPKRQALLAVVKHIRAQWWLVAGLLFELGYGLTMATHHMMFSFRFFVPYLPAAVIATVGLVQQAAATEADPLRASQRARLVASFLVVLTVFQLYQARYTYTQSVNGLAPIGEYRSLGVRSYVQFLQILEQQAGAIQQHWQQSQPDPDRPPRIITYAAGVLPYTYREAYIYEQLVSYRHCHQRHQQGLHADYLHILAPRQGSIAQQLPGRADQYTLISSYEMFFDGSLQQFLVFYNAAPAAHNLTATINEPCRQAQASTPATVP